jgi:outer membrane protein TolC
MAEVEWKSKAAGAGEAHKNAEITLITFKHFAGIPFSEQVILTQEYTGTPDMPVSPELDQALAARADYRALVLSRDLSDIERKSALAAFLPTASASFSYALGGMGNGDSLTGAYDFNSAALSMGVRVPLFSGGYRLARVKEAEIEQEKAALSLLQKQNVIEGELMEVRLRLIEAKERTESAFFLQETAQRALALSQTSFANGIITQIALAETINKVDEARIGFENAMYEYFSAYYDWELATGSVEL